MIRLSLRAQTQIASLTAHFVERERDDAISNLQRAIATASERILARRGPFYPAPRPYPSVARPGWRWLKAGSYWIAFGGTDSTYVVRALFHETANMPGRMPR